MTVLVGCYPEEWIDVSPDGTTLVYSQKDKGVFLLLIDGSAVERLSEDGWCPKVSPDGKQCQGTNVQARISH